MKKTEKSKFIFEVKEVKLPAAEDILRSLRKNKTVASILSKKSATILYTAVQMPDEKETRVRLPLFKAFIYDYKSNCCYIIKNSGVKSNSLSIEPTSQQPEPTNEEFNRATQLLYKNDEYIKAAAADKKLRIYKPMPPVIAEPNDDGSVDRILTVGIRSSIKEISHQIVGVNLSKNTVIRFEAIPFGLPGDLGGDCGIDYIQQPTTPRGTQGQYNVTVRLRSTNEILWKFLVIRPSASSGTRGSGIELRNVFYKGKKVLHMAHAPILNVRYDDDRCGPYRDWQYEESNFEAVGTDLAPGIRLCSSPARTIFQSGNDNAGNFRGVAIYAEGDTAVLISEMEAGWYRYITEWRFKANGTIFPRFGFSAVRNSCVCNVHHHHVYWRLDFDIESASNNIAQEFNDPPIFSGIWFTIKYETRRSKSSLLKRKWRIKNASSGRGYTIEPGSNDGNRDSFGVGDIWFVRYHGSSEYDDGYNNTFGSADQCKAHIDNFLTGESIFKQDIVVWYGAHFTHDVHDTDHAVGHIVGPTLKPINW
jgi:hypothetical protein